jgi:hypothetical protein
MMNPDITYSKIVRLVSDKCLCRGCFPVSHFKIPEPFDNAPDHVSMLNTLNDKLAECIGIEKGFLDAEFQSGTATPVR